MSDQAKWITGGHLERRRRLVAEMSKIAMVKQIGSLTGHVLKEKVRPRRPTELAEVPASPDHLTVEWLTAALCRAHPGAAVTGFSLGGGSDGSTSRAALTVSASR